MPCQERSPSMNWNSAILQGDTSRRRFLIVAAGAAAAALLTACGGSKATDTPKPAATTGAAPTTITPAATPGPATAAAATRPASSAVAPAGTPAPAATAGTTASAVSGTGTSAAAPIGKTFVVMAVEYGFQTSGGVIPAGLTTIQLKNLGKEVHEVGFVRLSEGATADQFREAVKKDEETAYALGTLEGGPNRIGPQGTSEVILDLAQGQYVLACFVNTADGITHAVKGMVLPLQVTAATTPAAPLPTGSGTFTLGNNGSDWPTTLAAGKSMYRVTNKADAAREFFIGRLATGKTVDDLKQALADPAANNPPDWFEPLGGMEGLKLNGVGVVSLDLKSGSYAAVDTPLGEGEPTLKGYAIAGY